MVLCPNRSLTILGWTPARRRWVAWLCRNPWNVTRGNEVLREFERTNK